MKSYVFNDNSYELVVNYRDGFVYDDVRERFTDFFDRFDYVCGDWAYGKLRLKGFFDESNKNVKRLNNYKFIDNYLKDNCANDARYFVIKKIS